MSMVEGPHINDLVEEENDAAFDIEETEFALGPRTRPKKGTIK
jgi:hypothetical protein